MSAAPVVRSYGQALKTYRSISHLLRLNKDKVSQMLILDHIRSIIRQHEATDQRLCRAPEELQFLGNCYRTYLESGQKYRELYGRHFGKGEKTVEQAAATVGLKLPKVPEHQT